MPQRKSGSLPEPPYEISLLNSLHIDLLRRLCRRDFPDPPKTWIHNAKRPVLTGALISGAKPSGAEIPSFKSINHLERELRKVAREEAEEAVKDVLRRKENGDEPAHARTKKPG